MYLTNEHWTFLFSSNVKMFVKVENIMANVFQKIIFIIELGFIFVYFPNKFFKISSQCTGITKKGFRRKSDFQDLRHCFSMR